MKKQNNDYRNQVLRGLKRKYESILSRGGKCEKCGYDKNISYYMHLLESVLWAMIKKHLIH